MFRKLTPGEPVEFTPPTAVLVVFMDSESMTFNHVSKAMKDSSGVIYLEFADKTFGEIHPPLKFIQIGETESGQPG